LLAGIRDRRRDPEVPVALVARILFLAGLLRWRSFNALEPKLAEPHVQRALEASPRRCGRVCSTDTLGYSLARMEVATVRQAVVAVNRKAERNKVFREGWHAALRFVALDGWEPIQSRERHCPHCLTREITVGEKKVTQYYHALVVALLLDERLEVVLDMEPIRSADRRTEAGEAKVAGHEGELTAAKRLVQRLRTTYGRWIDVLVGDALYANGPFLTLGQQCGYSVLVVVKKPTDEPLKEALALWNDQPPMATVERKDRNERMELWDCPALQTLSTYKGSIRVVRAFVYKEAPQEPTTWCFAVTGVAAQRLTARQVVLAGRGRWHLENTAFNQWTQHWRFEHVFTHSPNGIDALFWMFVLDFNLLQFFLYRQVRSYGRDRGKDVTRTILRLIDEMQDDLVRINQTLPWDSS
jgi:hypothetical protein